MNTIGPICSHLNFKIKVIILFLLLAARPTFGGPLASQGALLPGPPPTHAWNPHPTSPTTPHPTDPLPNPGTSPPPLITLHPSKLTPWTPHSWTPALHSLDSNPTPLGGHTNKHSYKQTETGTNAL